MRSGGNVFCVELYPLGMPRLLNFTRRLVGYHKSLTSRLVGKKLKVYIPVMSF